MPLREPRKVELMGIGTSEKFRRCREGWVWVERRVGMELGIGEGRFQVTKGGLPIF